MGKGKSFFENMVAQSPLTAEALPVQSVVEIAGDRRVLVEGHQGVLAYSREQIRIRVRYGSVCICGSCLEMIHMTKENLIVYGRIDSVNLQRRG